MSHLDSARKSIRISALLSSMVLGSAISASAQDAQYQTLFETRDPVRAVSGKAFLGSFGNPAINDKGSVAVPCALFSDDITSTRQYSIVFKRKSQKRARTALQGGISQNSLQSPDSRTLGNGFLVLPDGSGDNVSPVSGSARMFRIGRSVALNSKNRIAFAGQMIETIQTVTRDKDGVITKVTFSDQDFSTIGLISPSGKTFSNFPIVSFVDYNEGILERRLSVDQQGTVPYRAIFFISDDERLEGFTYDGPVKSLDGPLATVASIVIGLPYFTTFIGFSDPVITKGNECYVVAQISDEGSEFDGIWSGTNPDLQPLVVKERPAPRGGKYASFDPEIGPSASGRWIAFAANLTDGPGGISRAIFRAKGDRTETVRVAAVGTSAPGVPGGVFQQVVSGAANNRGQVVVLGTVLINERSRNGIWLSDNDGEDLKLVVIEGQEVRVGNETKTLNRLGFKPQNGLNNKGEVAFTASFTDRTSAVMSASF